MGNRLILNNSNENVLQELKTSMIGCKSFYFNVAFITFSGIQLLLEQLAAAEKLGIEGKVITSTYLNFTDPKAVRKINTFNNIKTKIFIAEKNKGFHPKAYVFEYEDFFKVIIGSSNITQSALMSNIEWNVSFISKNEDEIIQKILEDFERIWNISSFATDDVLNQYEKFLLSLKSIERKNHLFVEEFNEIKPNSMQVDALNSLERLRLYGEKKAIVIAATGSGKTYMSAFDVAQVNPKKMLFIVHREDILSAALESFKKIIPPIKSNEYGILSGNHKDFESDFLFSTNISLDNHISKFDSNHFDYIIIDEAHHIGGETYKRIIEYFDPKFLLGMTATPERGDAQDIYETFDNNVAIEIRLRDALDEDLVVPFHYFGITDAEGVDYSGVNMKEIAEVAKQLQTNSRVEHVINKMNFYGYEGDKRRGIGFCFSVEHAVFMSNEFNSKGIVSTYLTGDDKQDVRKSAIQRLESGSDTLEIIFTIDIFNEGIDIPSINTILMLRPTESPIIFIQQLGRGLRKHESKSFVTILDFIGNYSKSFMLAIALNGRKFFDKDSLKVAVKTDFANLPGCTHIQLDKIAKEQILRQIENENFNSFAHNKEAYLSFKLSLGNRIPTLLDFFSVDGAPDPMGFRDSKSKTFLAFQKRVEKDNFPQNKFFSNEVAEKFLRLIEDHLPAKRLVDLIAFKLIVTKGRFSKSTLKNECLKHLNNISDETLINCLQLLSGDFFDAPDNKKYPIIGSYDQKNDFFRLSDNLNSVTKEEHNAKIFLDSINYGICRYENEFTNRDHNYPDLTPFMQYSMRKVALTCNYNKKHSAFRGSTVPNSDDSTGKVKEYYLFVDLHKDENATAYRDKFISDSIFQWDSPDKTGLDTSQGINITNHVSYNIDLHLFVRKFKVMDGESQDFIYIGKGVVDSYEGTKPILFTMNLKNKVPADIYNEFVTVA
jgi:superfamily II DNA or RNA helicase/HKD family nuclease